MACCKLVSEISIRMVPLITNHSQLDSYPSERTSGIKGIKPGKQPSPVKHLALRTCHSPPHPQALQQDRWEHGVTVLAAFTLLHAQRHALTVNIGDLEREHFTDAQTRPIGHG